MGKRLTKEERARRDAAYQVWAKHDMDFAATAKETGIDEEELRRWDRVHRWWKRWLDERQAEIANLERVAEELDQLKPLITGITVDGDPLYIPSEVKLGAASQGLETLIGLGGEVAEATRVALRPAIPDAAITLACIARSVNRQGELVKVSLNVQEEAKAALIETKIVSEAELRRLPIQDLFARIRERLRGQGLDPIVH